MPTPIPDAGRSSTSGAPGASPFDALAADYDRQFTESLLGGMLRRAVWRRLDAAFAPGMRVLELACGTGEDAVHLAARGVQVLATDASAAMVEAARRKVVRAGVAGLIEARRLPFERLAELPEAAFDGAFANFGGINCAADLAALGRGLARAVKPGAPVLLCVMGPLVPWEWLWFGLRGDLRAAFRRLRRGGVLWRGLRVVYPSPRHLARLLRPAFRVERRAAIGALVPLPAAERWARRHPGLVARLDARERRWETRWPLPWLADHYLLELVRR
jgi:SAM-dependent methyltransferase